MILSRLGQPVRPHFLMLGVCWGAVSGLTVRPAEDARKTLVPEAEAWSSVAPRQDNIRSYWNGSLPQEVYHFEIEGRRPQSAPPRWILLAFRVARSQARTPERLQLKGRRRCIND